MEKSYRRFIGQLMVRLKTDMELEEEDIYIIRETEDPYDDRLCLEIGKGEKYSEVCALHIRQLFDWYLEGKNLDEIQDILMRNLRRTRQSGLRDKVLSLGNYHEIQQDLFVRLFNVDKYREDLKDAVYRQIGDIALVLYVCLGESEGVISSTKIRRAFVEAWGMDEQEVFDQAILNTYLKTPPRLYKIERLLADPGYCGETFMEGEQNIVLDRESCGNCLSTEKRINGAVAIFMPGVARKISQLLDSDLYLVFTSIHEVMIHSDTTVGAEDLRNILQETVRFMTAEEDFLTYKIYHYERKTGRFSVA